MSIFDEIKEGGDKVVNQYTAKFDSAEVSEIRDTSGAGDAFNAGYLAARLFGERPQSAAKQGQFLAAEVIRHFGARIPQELIRSRAENEKVR